MNIQIIKPNQTEVRLNNGARFFISYETPVAVYLPAYFLSKLTVPQREAFLPAWYASWASPAWHARQDCPATAVVPSLLIREAVSSSVTTARHLNKWAAGWSAPALNDGHGPEVEKWPRERIAQLLDVMTDGGIQFPAAPMASPDAFFNELRADLGLAPIGPDGFVNNDDPRQHEAQADHNEVARLNGDYR